MKNLVFVFIALLLFQVNSFACQASDADCIYISTITVAGAADDNIVLCNSCAEDIMLSGGVMVVDNNPANSETLADTTIPGLGCVTLTQDIDFSFGFSASNGDGFTLSCADGTVIVTKSFPANSPDVIFCADPPVVCDPANAASVYISKIIYDGPGDDQVIVCNSGNVEVALTGTTLADSGSSSMLLNVVSIPPMGCVALTRGIDFSFGLGDDDSFTISCGATLYDSVVYDEDGLGLECHVAAEAPAGPCDPNANIYISQVFFDSGVDRVVVCNNSASTASLDGAIVSDASNSETIFGLSIPPFSCITLERGVHFTFGLGSADSFTIACSGSDYDFVTWMNGEFADGDIIAPAPAAPGIPTMGEWGLISLSLCLLIFGAIRIKEIEQAIA